MITPLKEFQRGKVITADDLNAVVRQLRAFTPQSSATVKADVQTGGTTWEAVGSRSVEGDLPDFWVYLTDALKVTVTGGQLVSGSKYLEVSESAELTVTDGDKLYLQFNGDGAWEAAKGSDYPTNKLYWPLAEITTETADEVETISEIFRVWSGGDIALPPLFATDVTPDGGDSWGDPETTCDKTYTVKIGDCSIMTTATPTQGRFENTEYNEVTAGTGIVRFDALGNLELLCVVEEQPTTDIVQLQSQYQIDSNTNKFQVKFRRVRVIEAEDEDDEWTDVHIGTECP